MSHRYFLDTNILVYAQDPRDKHKQAVADELVSGALQDGQGVISSQVVQEFCNVATNKFNVAVTERDLQDTLRILLKRLWRHVPSIEFYQRAIDLHAAHSLNFYDALIVQAALDLDCRILYSEDMQDGRKFGSLTVKDPFK